MKANQQSGFTLVELVMVIVLLGILAAIAVPRFVSLSGDARKASVDAIAGGVKSAAAVAQAAWVAKGGTATAVSTADGLSISISSTNGFPLSTSAGIGVAMRCSDTSCDGFTAVYSTTTAEFKVTGAPTEADCKVTYNAATGAASTTKTGC